MAAGYGDSIDKRYGFRSKSERNDSSDDYPSSRPDNYSKKTNQSSYGQQDSTDDDDLTLEMVQAFKLIVQDKVRRGNRLNEPIVELEVSKIRKEKCPDQCSLSQWKKDLPDDIENCPDAYLRNSMAYGNNPHEVKSILQTKINNNNIPTEHSLNNIFGPLKNLKRELDNSRQPNLLRAIRKIDEHDINRANRLFLSEALHFASGAKDYTFADAQKAVAAIRQTDSESDDPRILIPIVKTLREVDDICEHLEKSSSKLPNQSSVKTSQFSDDNRTTSTTRSNYSPQSSTKPSRFSDDDRTTPTTKDHYSPHSSTKSSQFSDDDRTTPATKNNYSTQSSTKTSRFPDDDRTTSATGNNYSPQSSTKPSRFPDDDRTNPTTRDHYSSHSSTKPSQFSDDDRTTPATKNNYSTQSSTKPSRFPDDDRTTPATGNNYSPQSSTKPSRFPDDDRTTPTTRDHYSSHSSTKPSQFSDDDRTTPATKNNYSTQSSTKTSRFSDDDRTTSTTTNSYPISNNPGFRYKPLPDPFENSSQTSGRPRQPSDDRSKDEPIRNTSRRFNQDNN